MSGSPVALSSVAETLRSSRLLTAQRGDVDVRIEGVSQDSREVGDGDLFLAWAGMAHDAHDFVEDAARAGAVAAVVERPVAGAGIPQLQVSDGRTAAALAADHVLGRPWRDLRVVGVTGTNGKTTTAVLARHLLQAGMPSAAVGTLGLVETTGRVRPGTGDLTTPGPVRVARWLRELVDDGVEAVVVEASSHALEQRRLDGIRFETAVFTNLSRDHLDYHAGWEAYFTAKARLLGLVRSDGAAVVNGDVDAWDDLPLGRLDRLTYGLGEAAEIRARGVELDATGSRFRIDAGGEEVSVSLPLLGGFNVENALAAAAVALRAGADLDEVARGLEGAPQIPGRLEAVAREPFTVLIDFAHTPDALNRVLETLRPLTSGRLTVLFGAGGDRDREKRPQMARAVADVADRIVVTSDNPRTEDPERIIDDVEAGFDGGDHLRITDRREAIRRVLETAEPGEMILLAGKGHETYQVVGTEKRPFDEREIVREILSGAGGERP